MAIELTETDTHAFGCANPAIHHQTPMKQPSYGTQAMPESRSRMMSIAPRWFWTVVTLLSLLIPASTLPGSAQEISVAEALDCPELEWTVLHTHDHVALLVTQTAETYDGSDAVAFMVQATHQGGPPHLLETTVVGPGTISFAYRTKNEDSIYHSIMSYGDAIYFPGGYNKKYSGLTAPWWSNATFRVDAGVRTLSWGVFMSTTNPLQNMYIDRVRYTPDPGPPIIMAQPKSQSARLGAAVTFRVSVISHSQLSYQWRKNDAALADGGRITGATTPTLTVANLQVSDVGDYSVTASNDLGQTNSAVAALTLEPSLALYDGSVGFRSSQFGFNVYGRAGATAVVECSTNLVDWIPVRTNVLGLSPAYFSDPASAVNTSRWYRVR